MSQLPKQTIDTRKLISELTNLDHMRNSLDAAMRRMSSRRPAAAQAGARKDKAVIVPPLELPDETRRIIEAGAAAVEKIRESGTDVFLSPDEKLGVEAVIHAVGRPAILIRNDDFAKPTPPWEILEPERPAICQRILSVGRIERIVQDKASEVATGFMVAPDVVMTNEHVIREIADAPPPKHAASPWQMRVHLKPQINFIAESGVERTFTFPITEVIAVHPTFDLGLLRIGTQSISTPGANPPPPLRLASEPPSSGGVKNLYVIGYPASDNQGLTPDSVMRRIFADIYEVKRLQPGNLTNRFESAGEFAHDCSTLGGNSGSCVVDLDTGLIIGLHYSGSYMQSNYAVSLWKLKQDSTLKGAQVNFS